MRNDDYTALVDRLTAIGEDEAAEALETLDAAFGGLMDIVSDLPTCMADFFSGDKELLKKIKIADGTYDELDDEEISEDEDGWMDSDDFDGDEED